MDPDTAVRGCGVVDDHDQVVVLWNAYLEEYRIGQRNVSREAGVAEPVGREPARGVVTGVVGRVTICVNSDSSTPKRHRRIHLAARGYQRGGDAQVYAVPGVPFFA